MKTFFLLPALVILGAGALRASELHWNNGEMLGGDFIGMEGDHVIWRNPTFAEPVKVRLEVLTRINRFKLDEKTSELHSVQLTDGSRVYGSVTGLTEQTLELKSARSGLLTIRRSHVASVQRLRANGLLFAQPTSVSDWVEGTAPNASSDKAKAPTWRVIPGAALQQAGWNRTVSLPLEVPDLVEIQFTLKSSVRPEFKLELKAKDEARMIVETWVDDLVLQGVSQGRLFQNLHHLSEDDRQVSLHLFWNRQTGLCAVYGPDGKKIAENTRADAAMPAQAEDSAKAGKESPPTAAGGGGIFNALLGVVKDAAKVDQPPKVIPTPKRTGDSATPAGLTLLNKGPDMTLETLRIRTWDGVLPTDLTDVRPRVERTDAPAVKGEPVRATTTELIVREAATGKELSLPWEKVLSLELNKPNAAAEKAESPQVELWFTDGEWIQGRLLHVRGDTATLETAFSAEPVHFKITRMHHLQFKGRTPSTDVEKELAALDTLAMDNKVLHGTLDANGGAQPRWRVVGALAPVSLAGTGFAEITRSPSSAEPDPNADTLFYLTDGEVLPGQLRAMDSQRVDLTSPLSGTKSLPATRIQAIQFGGRPMNLKGFEDDGWKIVRGGSSKVRRVGVTDLEFEPGGSWGHPAFMQVNDFEFVLQSDGFNALRLRLFADCGNLSAQSVNLLIGHMGSEVMFGMETKGEQMDKQFRMRCNGPMPVRIQVGDNAIEVFLNKVMVRRIPIAPKWRSGSGLILEPASLWGNGEREVKITNFSARVAPGRIAAPTVEPRSKEHALTVPRFRKEDPPRHALIAANGDILRGVIEAATVDHFAVRSGLETVRVPRERVKAAVWLIKPVDDVNAAFEERARAESPPTITHWLVLNNGGRLGLKVERFADDAIHGTSELLGECHVPAAQVHAIRSAEPLESAAMLALRGWKLQFAQEPVLPETGGESSPMLRQDAKPFRLPLLGGGDFELAKEKGKVVVLDFWATWCGPCIKSLPEMMDEMSAFDAAKVRFIGVNQAEPQAQVKTFLEARGWKLEVALDANQRVGQSFGVEGIPHTVIIGPDGKVAYVKTGYEPGGAKKMAETVRKLLGEKEPDSPKP